MPGPPTPMVLVVNTHARAGKEGFADALQALDRLGLRPDDAFAVSEPGGLSGIVRNAVANGARSVVVGGGDGTVSAAAGELVHREVALGVIPLGTGNDFARALGLPARPEAACAALADCLVHAVDVGSINDGERFFLNAVTLGLTTEVTRLLDSRLKRLVGGFAYVLATLRALKARKPFHAVVRAGAQSQQLDALQVVAGNGRYQGGGRLVAPEASLGDGLLDVYCVKAREEPTPGWREALAFARFAGKLGLGRHTDDERVVLLRSPSVQLDCAPAQALFADGEEAGMTPVSLHIEPRALNVLVPAPPVFA